MSIKSQKTADVDVKAVRMTTVRSNAQGGTKTVMGVTTESTAVGHGQVQRKRFHSPSEEPFPQPEVFPQPIRGTISTARSVSTACQAPVSLPCRGVLLNK